MIWSLLEKEADAVAEGLLGRVEADSGEEVRTDRVHVPHLGEEVDDCCTDEHSYRIQQISEDVERCSIEVEVPLFQRLLHRLLLLNQP